MAPLRQVWLHFMASASNPEKGVREALHERGTLKPGMRLDEENDVEFIVGSCQPEVGGQYVEGKTDVMVADKPLQVFSRVHVLPYKDTFEYNYIRMYEDYITPFFNDEQTGEFTVGLDFAYKQRRFQVVGVEPANSSGVVGKNTEIFYEGPLIERPVLEKLHLLPYEEGLPEKYRPTKLSLDEDALLRDYIRPHFDQRSATLAPGDALQIQGVNFKIVTMRPAAGGGVGKETEICCKGVALKVDFAKAAAKAKAKSKAKAKASASGASGSGGAQEDGGSGNCTVS